MEAYKIKYLSLTSKKTYKLLQLKKVVQHKLTQHIEPINFSKNFVTHLYSVAKWVKKIGQFSLMELDFTIMQ